MRGVILAGGRGRRLQPFTTVLPKPLMPVGEQTILEIVVDQLQRAGFTRLTFAIGYLGNLIQAYFANGERFNIDIDYSFETQPLGTAGPLSLLDPPPDEDFLVMNGDILTDLDYRAFIRAHKASGAAITIAMYQKAVPISLGVLELDNSSRVTGYIEKPTLRYPVSTGIYCFQPQVLDHLGKNVPCDLPELILTLIKKRLHVNAYSFDGKWLDIGRAEDYAQAIDDVEAGTL